MLKYIGLFAIITVCNVAFSASYYTKAGGNGLFGHSSNWEGSVSPGSNTGYSNWSGVAYDDTIYINHPMSASADFSFDGKPVVVIMGNGATFNIVGNMTMNDGVKLELEEGSKLNIGGAFTASTAPTVYIDISGEMNVGNGISSIAGVWDVRSTGKLNVTGVFYNNSTTLVFNVEGKVEVSGNMTFHQGYYTIQSGGELISRGNGKVLFGSANVNNNGIMNFPNATSVDVWSKIDCDGSDGTGSVGFGAGTYCSSVCNTTDIARCVDNGVPLPIELNYFTVSVEVNEFVFNWETLTEKNNDYFTIEYSSDLNRFETVLEEEGAGTSFSPVAYERAITAFPFEKNAYFRLKQTDFDGQFSYSPIEVLNTTAFNRSGLSIYPNPTKGKILIKLEKINTKPVEAMVLSSSTLQVVDTFLIENGERVFDLTNYDNGVYFLKVMSTETVYKVIVQK